VELAENLQATSDLYAYVAGKLNIAPMFSVQSPLPSGVLVFPTRLEDSVLYVLVSDSAHDAAISFRDHSTGTQVSLSLRSQHAAIALVGKKEKKILAKYGF
jgi:hypothetical protein